MAGPHMQQSVEEIVSHCEWDIAHGGYACGLGFGDCSPGVGQGAVRAASIAELCALDSATDDTIDEFRSTLVQIT